MPAVSDERVIFRGHPSWRSMFGSCITGFLLAVGAGVAAGAVSAAIAGRTEPGWVGAAVLVVFAVVTARMLVRRGRVTYTITSQRLTIEVGLLGRDVHETRLEQIQNVNCSQSIFQRVLGVGNVSFDTVGGAAFDFTFRGVPHPRRIAGTVHDALTRRTFARV